MKKKSAIFFLGLLIIIFSAFKLDTPRATASDNCIITSFSAPTSYAYRGDTTTLTWSSIGCNYVTISGGYLDSNVFRIPNGSVFTGNLVNNVTFTIHGFGTSTTSMPVSFSIYVRDNSGNYIYPNNTNNFNSNLGALSAITTIASNIGSTTTRLNGVTVNSSLPFVAYFEYGTTDTLTKSTVYQNFSPGSTINFYDTISVLSNTTYYYRVVAKVNDSIVRGNVVSFTTPDTPPTPVNYTTGNSSDNSSNQSQSGTSGSAAVTVNVSNKSDKVFVGDTVEYTVAYTNGTSNTLSNSTLLIVLPQGFNIKQTTKGTIINSTTVSVAESNIAPNQSDSIFLEAVVAPNVSQTDTLVTNATLSYALPSNLHDSTVGYVINHAFSQNIVAGFTLGSGFFPTTIFGWLITVLIILSLILVFRRIARAKTADHGHGHDKAHH